ncbi:unnamed protein product, partial [Rotaria magnacalcarata]
KLYSTTTDVKSVLSKASKLDQVMNLLDDKMMMKSILSYPVTRRLRTIEPNVYQDGDQIYDPVYLIPVFYHSLGPECVVKCQQFVEKHCLAYCLMALSSRCGLLRAVVYNCLVRFEQHLVSQRFYCKEQLLTMFTLLKQSIKKSNLKLAPIVALFLSKLVDLFTHPESKIYRTITRFLLKQPYIDLVHIPLFGELFHSSTVEYKYERGWILNLLKHGIKDTIDYTLCTKAYVFKTLMAFYDCSLCDDSIKLEILNVFYSTSKIQDMLMSLLFDYGFLLWLQVIVKNCSSESLMLLSRIIQNIGLRLTSIDNQVQLLEFDCLLWLFIRRLKNETTIASSIADNVLSTLMKYQENLKPNQSSLDIKQIKHILICRLIPPIIENITLVHSGKLGITIVGGIGNEHFPTDHGIFIVDKAQLQTNQPLHLGDRLLSISSGDNINDLRFVTHADAKRIIESACRHSNIVTLRVGRARSVETSITPPEAQPKSSLRTANVDRLATHQSEQDNEVMFRAVEESKRLQVIENSKHQGQQRTETVFNGNRRGRFQLD